MIYSKYDKNIFSKRIRKRREELNLTRMEVAEIIWENEIKDTYSEDDGLEILNKKTAVIADYERGRSFPRNFDICLKLCQVLECELGFLFGGFDAPLRKHADLMESAGISEKAAKRLSENKYSYYPALSSVLENESFWEFLKMMETYKATSANTNDLTLGDYINSRIESAAKTIFPDDPTILTKNLFFTAGSHYCTELMEAYKNKKEG